MGPNDHNALPLLLNWLQDGATAPFQSLEERLGPTFDNITPKVDDGVTPHIISQLPDFINKKEDLFRAFISAYYEWLEQKTNVFGRTSLLQDINDIDTTLDEFIIHFKREFLLNFPEKLAVDIDGNMVNEKTLLKNIKDFYRSKGSETSYEFLFRVLYDSALDFYYPKIDILKASDGNWVEESAIKVTSINGTRNFKMSANKIEQINPNTNKVDASARVYRVHQYNIGTHEVTELFLNNIVGDFISGQKITCTLSDGTVLTEIVYGLFSEVQIESAGKNYKSGDFGIAPEGLTTDNFKLGEGGRAKVTDVSLKGEIKKAEVDNGGVNYVEPIDILFIGGDGQGRGKMYPKALVKYAGYFKNNNGKLSSNKRIQDGEYYQDYSYVLKAEVSLDSYKNIVKRLVHPAGMKMFGSISLMKSLKSDLPFHSEHQAYEIPIVGHYTPYRSLSTTNLRNNGVTSPASGPGAGWSGGAGEYASATIIGTAALNDEDGTNFILTNTDGSTVTFHTDPTKNFGDTSSDGGDHTWELNTRDINSVRKATQALYIACKTAIDAGELDMTIFPATVDTIADESQPNFTLTQKTSGVAGNTAITLITGVTEVNGNTTFTGGKDGLNGDISGTGDLYLFGYNPGATTNYHCFGNSGGKLIVRGPSLTAGSFPVGLQVSGDTSGASGEVLSFHIFYGTGDTGGVTTSNDVLGVLCLLQTPDMRPNGWCGPAGGELGELIGVTNAGHVSGTAAGGWTAEICAILNGSGIVSESLGAGTTLAGLIQHEPTNIPMGTAGTEGYTAAQEYLNYTGLTAYNYWEIYHHPNTRGLSGQYIAGGFTNGIPAGMAFDSIPLKTFFRMPIGNHFHSDPENTSAYYGSPTKEYSVPYGSTSGSPNLSTI